MVGHPQAGVERVSAEAKICSLVGISPNLAAFRQKSVFTGAKGLCQCQWERGGPCTAVGRVKVSWGRIWA